MVRLIVNNQFFKLVLSRIHILVFCSSLFLSALFGESLQFGVTPLQSTIDQNNLSERAVIQSDGKRKASIFDERKPTNFGRSITFEALGDDPRKMYLNFYINDHSEPSVIPVIKVNSRVRPLLNWYGKSRNHFSVLLNADERLRWNTIEISYPSYGSREIARIEQTNFIGYSIGLPTYVVSLVHNEFGPPSYRGGGLFLCFYLTFLVAVFAHISMKLGSLRVSDRFSVPLIAMIYSSVVAITAVLIGVGRLSGAYVYASVFSIMGFFWIPLLVLLLIRLLLIAESRKWTLSKLNLSGLSGVPKSFPVALSIALGALPILIWLFYGENLFFQDQWAQSIDVIQLRNHTFKWSNVLSTHGEFNKQTTARLLWIANSYIFNSDTRVPMALTVVILLLTSFLLYQYGWSQSAMAKPGGAFHPTWMFLPVCFLMFNVYQWEVILRSDEVVRSLGNFLFVLIAIGVTTRRFPTAVVILLAVALSFCQISGLLVWPLLAVLAFRCRSRTEAFAYVVFGAAIVGLYASTTDFSNVSSTLDSGKRSFDLLKFSAFLLKVVGSPFYLSNGFVSAALVSWILYRLIRAKVWNDTNDKFVQLNLLIGVFALLKAAMITVGRAHYGGEFSSRYAHEMQFLWISVWALMCHRWSGGRRDIWRVGSDVRSRTYSTAISICLALGLLANQAIALTQIEKRHEEIRIGSRHISYSDFSPHLYPITAHHVEKPSEARSAGLGPVSALDTDWIVFGSNAEGNGSRGLTTCIAGLVTDARWIDQRFKSLPFQRVLYMSGFVFTDRDREPNVRVRIEQGGRIVATVMLAQPTDRYDFVLDAQHDAFNWFAYIPENFIDVSRDEIVATTAGGVSTGCHLDILNDLANYDSDGIHLGKLTEDIKINRNWDLALNLARHSYF